MLTRRTGRSDDQGFTLIELLVVIMLMGFLGAITVAGIASAMRTTRQDSARANNADAMETQLQRMIKDVRVADPLRSVTSSSIEFDIYRGTGCRRIEWRVSGTSLQQRVQTWTATSACLLYPATAAVASDTGYVTRLSNVTSATPFSYLDNSGAVLTTPTTTTTKQVSVTITQSQPEGRGAISLTASTYLRNAL